MIDSQEIRKDLDCLRARRYPDFVFSRSGALRGGEVPVFTAHTIEPQTFEGQLRHLAGNGYAALSCDRFCDHLAGIRPAEERSVLLTIDDGRRSVWTFAYPLLKKYRLRATVFLIPGFVRETAAVRPNLEDVWAGRCRPEDLDRDRADADEDPLISWAEADRMHRDGVIDFQSHTAYHHHIFTGRKIVDFFHPGRGGMIYDVPMSPGREQRMLDDGPASLWGMPIYEHDALMTGRPRYIDDPGVTDGCIARVARSGGGEYFRRTGWHRELMEFCREAGGRGRFPARFQRPEEVAAAIRKDLEWSRGWIQDHLDGHRVRHLCYPYGAGSDLSVRLSREAGYASNFWSIRRDRRTNRPGDDPFAVVRLKADYIFRLAGRGRRSLLSVLAAKVRRRLSRHPDYGGLRPPGEQA
jgi:peptidoglycan/xylan/chitin deacetylase (PgdA/CDA1 family)